MSIIEMEGKEFGFWTVIRRYIPLETFRGSDRAAKWLCKCKCGNEKIINGDVLREGSSKSCGCWNSFENGFERALNNKTRNGQNGCIEWTGRRDKDGYARYGGKSKIVSRMLYQKAYGEIEKGLCVCHTCDNPGCVNIDHLWLGTVKENNTDKTEKKRTRYGSKHHKTHLTENDVIHIKILCNEGVFQSIIAEEYKISQSTVSTIKLGSFWKHVE